MMEILVRGSTGAVDITNSEKTRKGEKKETYHKKSKLETKLKHNYVKNTQRHFTYRYANFFIRVTLLIILVRTE